MLVVLVTSSMSVFAQTTPAIEKSTEVMQVYNGFGEFVGTIDSLDDLEQYGVDTKGMGTVIAKVLTKLGEILTVISLADLFTGMDGLGWLKKNIVIPFWDTVKEMSIYSVSGGINNPYPPNSYEGAMWHKNNFYVVVH